MSSIHPNDDHAPTANPDAEEAFRTALVRSHASRSFVDEVETAAAQFCVELRRQGQSPEHMLKNAKRVIAEAIDGHNVPVAERAVRSCIRNYYQDD